MSQIEKSVITIDSLMRAVMLSVITDKDKLGIVREAYGISYPTNGKSE